MAYSNGWLSHLANAVPKSAYGKRLSMYTIALEAWRRGIKVKFYRLEDPENKLRIRYSLSYQGREHKFESSRGDLLTEEAYDICDNKDLTKQYLSKAGVPVPEGKRFKEDTADEGIVDYANKLGYPLVLKPISENGGKGVVANIQKEDELKEALVHVRRELGYLDVIVEQQIFGDDFRIFVLDDKVIGAVKRKPANIVGDGVHTIQDLIEIKNNGRKKNPHHSSRLINVDKEALNLMRVAGYTLNSVPKSLDQVYLREKASISAGGESTDITCELPDQIKEMAIKAAQIIPGLEASGVDIIFDQNNNRGFVIEVNTMPALGPHLFPVEGKARDISKALVDYYFPESSGVEKTNLYFDFDSIMESLKSRSTDKVEATLPLIGKLYAKRYVISGHVQGVGYRKWIRKQALQRHLHGYTQNKESGNVVVVVAGSNQDDVNAFKHICYQGPDYAQVENVKDKDYEKPVKIGFEIKKESKENKLKKQLQEEKADKDKMKQKITKLERENNIAEYKLQKVQQQKEQLEQMYRLLKNSRSWRYTKPLRSIGNLTKRS
ncbi:acylphosphatase [Salicibibacter kimchii]|uniref:acylphosphatase n=1 Tax=Salicibibacter kimchii TaxID=2099786 RepID=A0A345BZZ9_9BACI|nr:acylphosphatase [Salicibibacter kimchii]AXF56530.1 hypothetical protein DT065_11180 [Salicibibacter kimchii]